MHIYKHTQMYTCIYIHILNGLKIRLETAFFKTGSYGLFSVKQDELFFFFSVKQVF